MRLSVCARITSIVLVKIDFYRRLQVDFSVQGDFSRLVQNTLTYIFHGRNVLAFLFSIVHRQVAIQ